ncbi:MAG TPA: hypothetical protein VH969_32330 [Actinophytocola sp.]|jgi:hypothetical protein|uniref:hypothetical protein n=1 Tax=Actinophytocola sp. TaxID=1872138 RepID=UPI002F929666
MIGLRRFRRQLVTGMAVVVLGTGTALATPAAATADPLAGEWAALSGCPVDDPAMLAADGASVVAACLGGGSPGGTITMGGTTMPVGKVDLSFGMLNQGGTYSLVLPANGGLSGDPIVVPGGLLGLMCPSDIPVISEICDAVVGSPLNTVTATLEPAGPVTDFDLAAAVTTGRPIMTLPVKIHLQNPFLDRNCYIGAGSDPMVLKVANQSQPAVRLMRYDADGTPNPAGEMNNTVLSGAAVADRTFAVPKARNCGLFGLIDSVVNARQGLPSPAGSNSLVLDGTGFTLGGFANPRAYVPTQGRQLADRWHAAGA